ncbi:hypothetical protein HMPREF1254_1454 [Prevotella sp. BV3P1]|nr:hypothetical protein HMPREF1254_1454 [Prevotella sp. BV3P1]
MFRSLLNSLVSYLIIVIANIIKIFQCCASHLLSFGND